MRERVSTALKISIFYAAAFATPYALSYIDVPNLDSFPIVSVALFIAWAIVLPVCCTFLVVRRASRELVSGGPKTQAIVALILTLVLFFAQLLIFATPH